MHAIDEFDIKLLNPINGMQGSLAQRVYHSLREAILDLHLAPGMVLRKAQICEYLGVSRSPVSEAIARLAAEGLLDVVPQSVTRVSCFSMSEIREGAFLREALELAAVSRVAAIRSDAQVAELKQNLLLQNTLVEQQNYAAFYRADEQMHRLIMHFTGFENLAAVANNAWIQVDRARRLLLPNPGRTTESLEQHHRIVKAIELQDTVAAREAMQLHLSELVNRLEPLLVERPSLFSGRK